MFLVWVVYWYQRISHPRSSSHCNEMHQWKLFHYVTWSCEKIQTLIIFRAIWGNTALVHWIRCSPKGSHLIQWASAVFSHIALGWTPFAYHISYVSKSTLKLYLTDAIHNFKWVDKNESQWFWNLSDWCHLLSVECLKHEWFMNGRHIATLHSLQYSSDMILSDLGTPGEALWSLLYSYWHDIAVCSVCSVSLYVRVMRIQVEPLGEKRIVLKKKWRQAAFLHT